jgi:hypothetical protein
VEETARGAIVVEQPGYETRMQESALDDNCRRKVLEGCLNRSAGQAGCHDGINLSYGVEYVELPSAEP